MSYWVEQGVLWYANDLPGGFYSKHSIDEAKDTSTLTIFNLTWAKDAKHVWANGSRVRKVYAPAFQALNECFGRDNECVFDSLGRAVKGINAAAFEVLDDGLRHNDDGEHPDEAGYARCEGKIYHYEWGGHKTMAIRGADAETFEVLKWGFARDKNKVFLGINVAKANPQTFRHITCRFGHDGKHVFYLNRIVPEADPNTFEFLGDKFWAKGRSKVFCHDTIVPGADPTTAKLVGSFLKDANHIFFFPAGFKKLEGMDPATFEVFRSNYYRDKARIYCTGCFDGFVEEADLATFEELPALHPSRGDAWDKDWIYRGKNRLKPRSEYQE
jgi:hypothetical protein